MSIFKFCITAHDLHAFAIFRLFFGAVTSQERTQWCSGVVSHADIPLPEDFLVNIFDNYGNNETCTITEHGDVTSSIPTHGSS